MAADFLNTKLGYHIQVQDETWYQRVWRAYWEHLLLVVVSLVLGVLAAIPLGILAAATAGSDTRSSRSSEPCRRSPPWRCWSCWWWFSKPLALIPGYYRSFLLQVCCPSCAYLYASARRRPDEVRRIGRRLGVVVVRPALPD